MFEVRITAEAKQLIDHAIANHEGPKPGLMIHRQGPVGDVSRSTNGDVQWQIERHHPWAIQVGAYGSIPDNDENIVFVEGIRVWLPLIPRTGEEGVVVSVREGQLHVEAIDV
jgi:hypothetical protein